MQNLVKLDKLCVELGVTTTTVKNWYKWFYDSDTESIPEDLVLPEYQYGPKGVWLFNPEDIELLQDFRSKVNGKYRGIMANFNAKHYWGKYGKERTENGK